MAQYFSSAPIDLGGSILSRAYSDANQAIIQGLSMYGKRKEAEADRSQQEKMLKLQEEIRAKAAEDAARREMASYFGRSSAENGLTPVMGADGSIDYAATGARIKAAQLAAQLAQRKASLEQDRNLNIGFKAQDLGIGAKPAMASAPIQPQGGINQFASPGLRGKLDGTEAVGMGAQPGGEVSLARQVAEAEKAAELDKYKTQRQLTAEAQKDVNDSKESMQLKNIKAEAIARKIDPESEAGKNFIAFRMKLSAMPADAKYAALTVQDMVKTGLIKNDPDAIEREEARLLPFGGKTPTLTPAMEKSIVDESNLVMNLGSVEKAISSFEQKYGPGSFDRYVGPIDNRTNEWKLQISDNAATQADKDAKRIAQLFQTTFNADLKATSGGAVTESEAVRKIREAGSLDGASFKNSLQGWREARIMGLKNKERVLSSFAVPKGLFNYGEEEAAPAGPVVAPAPGLIDAAKAELARRKGGRQ